jgi:hypothetical protein
MMQQRGQFEAIDRLFDLATKAGLDENAKHVLMVSEGLRAAAEALGPPGGVLRSREDYDAMIDSRPRRPRRRSDMEDDQQGGHGRARRRPGRLLADGRRPGGGQGGRPMKQAA